MKDGKRNYKKQYEKYDGKESVKKDRAKRNAARAKMEKAGKVRKGDGKDVDHKNGIAAGNSKSNLRVQDKSKNRSFERNKDGSVKKRRK
jgi:hypothetical protein